jgi:hypothetical protein
MNVRELLQTEIWSKRTSRKILVVLAIICVGLILSIAAYVVDESWITPSERSAGRAALAQIDGLQNFDGMSDAEFDAGVLQAGRKVDDAEQAAWTSRDKRIAGVVSFYLSSTKDLRDRIKSDRKLNLPADKAERVLQAEGSSRNSQKLFGQILHVLLEA